MSTWYRVFGVSGVQPEPEALLEYLKPFRFGHRTTFYGDDLGWARAEIHYQEDAPFLKVQRFLAEEQGIRAQLNIWAAWIESANHDPAQEWLLEHMISTKQFFTIEPPAEHADQRLVKDLCLEITQFLARETGGIYQIDDQGMFAADGTLLLEESRS